MNRITPQWARYRGQIYMCDRSTNTHVLLRHPMSTGDGDVNIALNGLPLLVPGMIWIELATADFFKDEPIATLPAIPSASGLHIGTRAQWGTSLAEWAVLSISGDNAKVRQVSGWNQAMIYDAPISELMLLRPSSVADLARAA